MSEILDRIRGLVEQGRVRLSDHGYEGFMARDIFAEDVIAGCRNAVVVEDYPDAGRGPTVLVLQLDRNDKPLHILWAIPAGQSGPAVVVTGYRPDPSRWSEDYLKRKLP